MSQYPQGIFQTLAWLVKQVKLLLWKTKDSYKVYTALLTQSGGDSPLTLAPGAVTKGVTYKIGGNSDGDFINVGAPNNNEQYFFCSN